MHIKYLLALSLLLACGSAWAAENWLIYKSSDGTFYILDSHVPIKMETLSAFVSSGQFCEFRKRHQWEEVEELFAEGCNTTVNWSYHSPAYRCAICHRCRKRIKVSKEVEEWEP